MSSPQPLKHDSPAPSPSPTPPPDTLSPSVLRQQNSDTSALMPMQAEVTEDAAIESNHQPTTVDEEKEADHEDEEGTILAVKRIARRYDPTTGTYCDEDDIEIPFNSQKSSLDKQYAFSVIRTFSLNGVSSTTTVCVRSTFVVEAAKVVMQPCRDIDWIDIPLEFSPEKLIAWLPRFKVHLATYASREEQSWHEQQMITHLRFFINFLEEEFHDTLYKISTLLAEDTMTFDLLWSILFPGDIILSNCHVTGEPVAGRLISATLAPPSSYKPRHWKLKCEFIDFFENIPGVAETVFEIEDFGGACAVSDLEAFPKDPFLLEPARSKLYDSLVARGKRCTELSLAWCHKRYSGTAYKPQRNRKIGVKSRIILDRKLYDEHEGEDHGPIYSLDGQRLFSRKIKGSMGEELRVEPTELELMLMPAVLYGFSLGDRKWLQFNVNLIEDIVWNPQAFDHLDIPPEKKELIRTLTESHARNAEAFDDFIEGKGIGLIFNLHGPPGVGKTLTAEATSEVAQSPLYIVSAGDLGTDAAELDDSLTDIFDLASAWRVVVLIDEADVFLEQRDLHDLVRNAMVAVFLRQLEYYPGILILTTNRVNIMDNAIRSRIHVSLHYEDLDLSARRRLWQFFLDRAGMKDVNEVVLDELGKRRFNGREIKNIVKVAVTFASHQDRSVEISDIRRVVGADEKWLV